MGRQLTGTTIQVIAKVLLPRSRLAHHNRASITPLKRWYWLDRSSRKNGSFAITIRRKGGRPQRNHWRMPTHPGCTMANIKRPASGARQQHLGSGGGHLLVLQPR